MKETLRVFADGGDSSRGSLVGRDIERHPGPGVKRSDHAQTSDLLVADVTEATATRYAKVVDSFDVWLQRRHERSLNDEVCLGGSLQVIQLASAYLREGFRKRSLTSNDVSTRCPFCVPHPNGFSWFSNCMGVRAVFRPNLT